MATVNSTGTCLSVANTLPATYDAAGFATITGYSQVGEINTVGPLGRQRKTGERENLCSGATSVTVGAYQAITQTLTCALDDEDAGQILMEDSLSDPTKNFSFKVVYASGRTHYFIGVVSKIEEAPGDSTSDIMVNYDISIKVAEGASQPFIITPSA